MSDEIYRVFENLLDVVFVVDADRNLHFANAAAALMLDTSSRRLRSKKPLENYLAFSPDFLDDGQNLADVEAATQMREIRFRTPDGKEGWAQVSIQSIPEAMAAAAGEEGKRWLLYLRDVTLEKNLHDKYKGELDQKEAVIEDLRKARNELENYSKNLEKMVEMRTAELREANRLLGTILDSLGQGIFVFDSTGKCLPIYSKVCEELFEMKPADHMASEVLRLSSSERETFNKWIEAAFSDMIPFDDLRGLAPSRFHRSEQERHISLVFNPLIGESAGMRGIVLVATDKTDEMKARQEAERERKYARSILQIVRFRRQFRLFLSETARLCAELNDAMKSTNPVDVEEITRSLHTIKGGAASFGLNEAASFAHTCEDFVMIRKHSGEPPSAWGADFRGPMVEKVAKVQKSVSDFVEKHAFLVGSASAIQERTIEVPVSRLDAWRSQLHGSATFVEVETEISEDFLLEPAERFFAHLSGPLGELAENLGKKMRPLEIIGGDTRLRPEKFTELFATFIHGFRNAVDHGLETMNEREAAGKSPEGHVSITIKSTELAGAPALSFEIRDDGRGIDPARIRAKLVKKNLAFDANASDDEIIQSVFRSDFSTAEAVTDVSGRGVGLSAVKEFAERMGGTCRVSSSLGQGSALTVIVPDKSRDLVGATPAMPAVSAAS